MGSLRLGKVPGTVSDTEEPAKMTARPANCGLRSTAPSMTDRPTIGPAVTVRGPASPTCPRGEHLIRREEITHRMAWHGETSWVDQILLLAPELGLPGCQWEGRPEGALGLGEAAGELRSQGTQCVNGGTDVQRETYITRDSVIVWVVLP